jgi:hypothetical protein
VLSGYLQYLSYQCSKANLFTLASRRDDGKYYQALIIAGIIAGPSFS